MASSREFAVRTVVFDLGRTLIPFSFEPLAREMEARREAILGLAQRYETGQIASDAFREQICGLSGVEEERFPKWWCSIFTLEPLVPLSLLEAVQQRCRLGLLSNTNPTHYQFLRAQFPWLDRFDFRTLSFEAGAAKPDPAIYADVERKAGCAPQDILYFDDMPQFVEAARFRGWQAEVFRDQAGVEEALARHGVLAPV
ncbi:MAG: HAD family hydrolase [Terriglobales bacterium]